MLRFIPRVIYSAAACEARRHKGTDAYLNRHVGSTKQETEEMLKTVGKTSLQEMVQTIIPPEAIRPAVIFNFHSQSELEALSWLRSMGAQNRILKSMIGQGYYECIIPPAITKNVMENPMWYTPYIPLHAEISQGRLEALLNFQTVVIELTKMDLAGAATPCQATACSEALSVVFNFHDKKRKKIFVSDTLFPSCIANMKTRAESLGVEVVVGSIDECDLGEKYGGVFVQSPAADGALHDFTSFFAAAKQHDTLCCCGTDLLACSIITPPGEIGADIVVGSAQRFGMPLGYGGPHAAFIAMRNKLKHLFPGQLVGITQHKDTSDPVIQLVMRQRETSHAKEHSNSFVETAPFLPASVAAFYAMYHGPRGLQSISHEIHKRARMLCAGFKCIELRRVNEFFFDTLTIQFGFSATRLTAEAFTANCAEKGINVHHNKSKGTVSISVDECTTNEYIYALLEAAGMKEPNLPSLKRVGDTIEAIPSFMRRTSKYLAGMMFQTAKSETELMRYVQRLQRRDFNLTHGMMPIGSSSMKLNSAVVMDSLTWDEFIALHPYAPDNQTRGINTLIVQFKQKLCDIFGMAACSIQPNSAALGIYTGVRIIQAYHQSRGQPERDVCFLPKCESSTNIAASALAGLTVVYVDMDASGRISMKDLQEKCEKYASRVSTLLLTYPNVYGVYDRNIVKIIELVHSAGGQCFVDGIHMNAMVGYTGPGFIGGDVCSIPLHKTFALPHASGGAGVGAIVVRQHLAPFLPNSTFGPKVGGSHGYGVASQSGYGSASMICAPHSLIKLLGSRGLKTCTDYAILNANYLKKRLEKEFTIAAIPQDSFCAHQFVIDARSFEKSSSITAMDIAKRLIDYSFHPPLVNYPFEGALLIEPTECECKRELDRFADAMLSIRLEIRAIELGTQPRDGNVLKRAPHTAKAVASETWDRPYTRQKAAYPTRYQNLEKYWPLVDRVDDTECPFLSTSTPLEFYQ